MIPILNQAFTQDISGTWVGNYGWNLLSTRPLKLVVEINLHNDSIITGLSHLYYRNNKYEHYTITGIYHRRDSTFTFKEDSVIAVQLGWLTSYCKGIYKTKLNINDTTMRQEGRWKDQQFLGCPATRVWLVKQLPKKAEPRKASDSATVAVINPLEKIFNRRTSIQQLLEIPIADKDSIKVEIYDNGVVDDDSVSVYADESQIFSHRRISNEPLTFYLSLSHDKPIQKIRLVAENLGTIPPCTAVMIITTRHKRSEVRLSSDYGSNAAVEFFLRE